MSARVIVYPRYRLPDLDLNAISHPIVRSAIEAMNGRNKEKWYALFSNNPKFTADGNPHDLAKWCERELFGSSKAYLATIDKVGNGGLTIYGGFGGTQNDSGSLNGFLE